MIVAEVVYVVIDNYTLFAIAVSGMWIGMIFFKLKDIHRTMENK